jgi:hypothetical protein
MYRTRALALVALAFLALPLASARADFYVGFGRPRPYYRYNYYRSYYYPGRVYLAPPPVYVGPRPVYVAPAPVYVQPAPAPVYVQPAPTYLQAVPGAPTQFVPTAPPGP